MSADPIQRALAVVLARWDPKGLVGCEFKLVGARAPVVVTGYSPQHRNVHYKTASAVGYRSWMNVREFIGRLG